MFQLYCTVHNSVIHHVRSAVTRIFSKLILTTSFAIFVAWCYA